MTDHSERHGGWRTLPWRMLAWGAAALLLCIPLITRAPWTLFDYLIMGALLGGAGLVLELVVRSSSNLAYRAGAGLAVAAAFLLVWVNGAVGFLGDEDNPANLLFFGVIGVAVMGAVLGRFKAPGMARAMFAAAAAQVLVGAVALAAGLGSPGTHGLYEAIMGTTVFAAIWLLAGGLFRKASEPLSQAAGA